MATEVEARFRADGRDRLARLATLPTLGGATLGEPRSFEEVDDYLDTDEGALRLARWACRLRQRPGRVTVSLKGPADAPATPGGVHRRPEVEGPATASHDPADWPPSEARALVDRLRRGGDLRPRLRLRQGRTERTVTLAGRPIATLSLDAVAVHAPDAADPAGEFHVVELELAPGSSGEEAAMLGIAAALGREPGLVPDPQTKLEHALELLDDR